MKKAIIVDDEQLAIDTLRWQIKEFCTGLEIVESFTNPIHALEYLQEHTVDLCFLDIDMPEMSGFDLLKRLGDYSFDVIFTTAFDQYAINAFKVSALDYLLKPIDEEELAQTVKKYLESSKKSYERQIELMLEQLRTRKSYSGRIALGTAEGVHFINVEKIIRLESDKNYTTIVLRDSKSIVVSKTIKDVEKLLDPDTFIRIHKSHVVNYNAIEVYHRGSGGEVELSNGDIIPVSKLRKEEITRRLM